MEIAIGIYFVIGALWASLNIGYAREKEFAILFSWLIAAFWPLWLAYGVGQAMRK